MMMVAWRRESIAHPAWLYRTQVASDDFGIGKLVGEIYRPYACACSMSCTVISFRSREFRFIFLENISARRTCSEIEHARYSRADRCEVQGAAQLEAEDVMLEIQAILLLGVVRQQICALAVRMISPAVLIRVPIDRRRQGRPVLHRCDRRGAAPVLRVSSSLSKSGLGQRRGRGNIGGSSRQKTDRVGTRSRRRCNIISSRIIGTPEKTPCGRAVPRCPPNPRRLVLANEPDDG